MTPLIFLGNECFDFATCITSILWLRLRLFVTL